MKAYLMINSTKGFIKRYYNTISNIMETLGILAGILTAILLVISAVLIDDHSPERYTSIDILLFAIRPASIIVSLIILRFILKKIYNSISNQEERLRQVYRDEKERAQKQEGEENMILRECVDLILEQVNSKYRVRLIRGDKTEELLYYKAKSFDFPSLVKSITSFIFHNNEPWYNINYTYLFPESALPTLKMVIQHYQKYKNLNMVPDEIIPLERFIISRPVVEDPPDLRGIDTLHDLAPLLIQSERAQDHKAINKILDKMEIIKDNRVLQLQR